MSYAGREMAEWCCEHNCDQSKCRYDHIEADNDRLHAENKRLREALEASKHIIEQTHTGAKYDNLYFMERMTMVLGRINIALTVVSARPEALKGGE